MRTRLAMGVYFLLLPVFVGCTGGQRSQSVSGAVPIVSNQGGATATKLRAPQAVMDEHNLRVQTQQEKLKPTYQQPLSGPPISPTRALKSVTDSWENPPFYTPPPSTLCLLASNHDADPSTFPVGGPYTGSPPPQYDCWVAAFDMLTVPQFIASPYNYNPNELPDPPPIDMCMTTYWSPVYAYGSLPDPALSPKVDPPTTGMGDTHCRRSDYVKLQISRNSLKWVSGYIAISAQGALQLCMYDLLHCASPLYETNVLAQFYSWKPTPPPPCVPFSAQAYQAAQKYGIRPTLFAAIAAQESGTPAVDDGRDIYQPGGNGQGPWMVDVGEHPDYTGGLDIAANADYAANLFVQGLNRFSGNESAAEAYYNSGSPNPIRTSSQPWNDGLQDYPTSVQRHEQRIIDYKSVCQNGKRG